MSFVKRSRIVSIRVSLDEYQTLERISRRAGANSVSGFIRQVVLSSETFNSAAREGSREVTEEIEKLKRRVDRLSQILKQRLANDNVQDAIPDEARPQIGMLLQREPVTEV
jgi:hypothetical protein